jgi:MFS family permease
MRPFYVRELTRYPTGARRLWLVAMAVIASLIANYELQIAPVVPLLLEDLRMSLTTYGLIAAASVGAGAISSAVGGLLIDRYGRVTILIPTLALTALTNYLMVIVDSPGELLAVRCLMHLIEGAAITTTAGMVRDFAPRVGRASAFAFWTWGPIGAAFMGSGIAGLTLGYYGTWQSQFIIMGTVALAMTVLVATQIADLSPRLRAEIIESDAQMSALPDMEGGIAPRQVRILFRHPHMWIHVVGSTLWLSVFYTLIAYGPTLLNQAFGMPVQTAALVGAATAAVNGLVVIGAGWLSDRLRLRRPFALAGTVLSTGSLAIYVPMMDSGPSTAQITIASVLLGGFLGIAVVPWLANFSENAEDIEPSLQGTVLGIWGGSVRLMLVVLLIVAPAVAKASSWTTWVAIITVAHGLFIPAVFFFKGPWRRTPPAAAAAQPEQPQPVPEASDPAQT